MKAAFLPTFLLELALLSCGISAAPVPANEVCTLDGYQFKCQNGVWPRDKDMTFPAVTDQTTALHFEKFTFHEENLRPLPAVNLTNLGILTFDNVTVWNSAGKSVGLPLQQLTQRLNRVSVTTLRITDTEVGVLDASYFTGFRGLLSLSIKYCTVESVTPDAFQPLRLEGGGSVLTELQFSANKGVKTFPWDAIVPVAPSIRVVMINENNDLTQITFTPPQSTLEMKELQTLEISRNYELAAVPDAILRPVGQNTARHTTVKFELNGNQCEGCALNPFYAWVRNAGATTTGTRELWVSCWSKCATSYDTPTPFGGTVAAYWGAYKVPECKADIVKTCSEANRDGRATTPGSNASTIQPAILPLLFLVLTFAY